MLRLRVAATVIFVVAGACGPPPTELSTIADRPAVVPADLPRHRPAPTTTTAPVAPPTTAPPTSTTIAKPPATTVPPAPDPGPVDGCLGWADEIAAEFPAEQVTTACRVMVCETGGTGDPTIRNPTSSSSGLFQFIDSTWRSTTGLGPPASAYPAQTQIAAAAALWRSSGWTPWACAT